MFSSCGLYSRVFAIILLYIFVHWKHSQPQIQDEIMTLGSCCNQICIDDDEVK